MTPREQEVVRAVVRALRSTNDTHDMLAFALMYGIPHSAATVRGEMEAMLLEALIFNSKKEGQ